jgi:hypothetical protein
MSPHKHHVSQSQEDRDDVISKYIARRLATLCDTVDRDDLAQLVRDYDGSCPSTPRIETTRRSVRAVVETYEDECAAAE